MNARPAHHFAAAALARRTGAFSLLEVMCAILILGVGLVGITQGITTALSASKESEVQTAAALLAAGRIETLRAEGYLTDGSEEGAGSGALSLYKWKQTVSASTIDGLHEVEVTVLNAKTGQLIYELRTLLFEAPYTSDEQDSRQRSQPTSSRRRENRRR
jgi:prepilin-type N-terminal cleavage/methylation domain-containing protein